MDFSAIQNYCPMKNKVGKQDNDKYRPTVRQTDRETDRQRETRAESEPEKGLDGKRI